MGKGIAQSRQGQANPHLLMEESLKISHSILRLLINDGLTKGFDCIEVK